MGIIWNWLQLLTDNARMHIQSSCGSHSHHPISPSLHIVVCRQLVNPRHRHHQHHHLVLCSDSFCSSSAMMLRRACSASSSSCCCLYHASSSFCRRSNSSRRSDATDLRASDNMAIYHSQMIVSRPTTLSYSRFSTGKTLGDWRSRISFPGQTTFLPVTQWLYLMNVSHRHIPSSLFWQPYSTWPGSAPSLWFSPSTCCGKEPLRKSGKGPYSLDAFLPDN